MNSEVFAWPVKRSSCGVRSSNPPQRLYVGNLPYNIRERDIEDLFLKFGRIHSLDLKTPHRGTPFAFIEFDGACACLLWLMYLHMACQRLHVATLIFPDARDADEAIHRRNGYDFDGCRLRVELSRGGRGRDAGRHVSEDDGRRGGGGRRRSRSRSHGRRRRSRSPHRRSRSPRHRSRSWAAAPASKKSRSRSRSPAARSKPRSSAPAPKPKSPLRSLTVSSSKVAGTALL